LDKASRIRGPGPRGLFKDVAGQAFITAIGTSQKEDIMKNMKQTALFSIMGVMMALIIASAHAGEQEITLSIGGSFISTPIDVNSDNAPASHLTGTGKSNLGTIFFHRLHEPDFSQFPPPVTTCPNGEPGFNIETVHGSSVFQVENEADLFFTETSSGTNCFPLSCFREGNLVKGCTFFVDTKANITGGTGKFAGASGFLETSGRARVLLADPTGIFAGFTSEGTGTINIP
jgi:hypothetical protein